MTLLEILDTSIKIGLGALITGIIAYFNQKANISALAIKENPDVFARDNIDFSWAFEEEFLAMLEES